MRCRRGKEWMTPGRENEKSCHFFYRSVACAVVDDVAAAGGMRNEWTTKRLGMDFSFSFF
jgi:hypothetical protein